MTLLLPTPRRGRQVGLGDLWVKNESQLSTGSFMSWVRAVALEEERILERVLLAAATEGISVGLETATSVDAAEILAAEGWIEPQERVIIYNCGVMQKYTQARYIAAAPDRFVKIY